LILLAKFVRGPTCQICGEKALWRKDKQVKNTLVTTTHSDKMEKLGAKILTLGHLALENLL